MVSELQIQANVCCTCKGVSIQGSNENWKKEIKRKQDNKGLKGWVGKQYEVVENIKSMKSHFSAHGLLRTVFGTIESTALPLGSVVLLLF